jgi:hypothetical protein
MPDSRLCATDDACPSFSNPDLGTPQQMNRATLLANHLCKSIDLQESRPAGLFPGNSSTLVSFCQLPEFRTPADSDKTRQLCGWAASTLPAHRAATRRNTPHFGTGSTCLQILRTFASWNTSEAIQLYQCSKSTYEGSNVTSSIIQLGGDTRAIFHQTPVLKTPCL